MEAALRPPAPDKPEPHDPSMRGMPPAPMTQTLSHALTDALVALGIRRAFGVTGGSVATFCDAVGRSSMDFVHFRHETGAAFAATEAYFASGEPTLVFSTCGPGVTNAITGMTCARWEGAKVVFVSGSTSVAYRGRWVCQETSAYTFPSAGIFTSGPVFDYAVALENPAELDVITARIAHGLARPGGFVAHVSLPITLQGSPVHVSVSRPPLLSVPTCSEADAAQYARMLAAEPFVIWAGFGARHAWRELRALAALSGAPVMCSPRGKGIFPERDPQFLGVTGLGGYGVAEAYIRARRPRRVLVLGTRLGESTSYWEQDYLPDGELIHVDIDPQVPGSAYPGANTVGVHAEVRAFLAALVRAWPSGGSRGAARAALDALGVSSAPVPSGVQTVTPRALTSDVEDAPVRPTVLMDAVQRRVVDRSDAIVMAESGNAFAWAIHALRFDDPGRCRVSVGFGSMGHFTTGVVGAALAANGRKAVALVGDGAMLMNSEVSTAVQHGAPAVWVVLNDAGYGMVRLGMRAQGFKPRDTDIPRVDFVALARAVGADGVHVSDESALDAALDAAMAAPGPFVVDVRVDPTEPGPWMKRIRRLMMQGATGPGEAP